MKINPTFLMTGLVALMSVMMATSCSTPQYLTKTSSGKTIDTRLVGEWEGSEADNQIKGMTKQWKMERTADGRFILDFKATMEGETQRFVEEGSWWVKDGKFYELHDNSSKTDTYEYTLLNEDQVKFKSISLSVSHEIQDYEFIDTRIKGADHN